VSGFYRIKAQRDECIGCRSCEEVCDMGIPIARMVKEKGQIRTIECMGCGRCVNTCPQNALSFYSVVGLVKERLPRRK